MMMLSRSGHRPVMGPCFCFLFFFTVAALACAPYASVAAAATAAPPTCAVVDPYAGACLTVEVPVLPCPEDVALAKCGCRSCALPGDDCACLTVVCDNGRFDAATGTCACDAGWTTEYPQFPCASRMPLVGMGDVSVSAVDVARARVALFASSGPSGQPSAVELVPPIALAILALIVAHFMIARA